MRLELNWIAAALALALLTQPGCRWRHARELADPGALEVTRYRVTEAEARGQTYIMAEIRNPASQPMAGATATAMLRGAGGETVGSQSLPVPRLKPGESCVVSFDLASHGKHKDVSFSFAAPSRGPRKPEAPASNDAH